MSSVSPQFQAFILDLLAPLARRMFGGVGLFRNGVMFGLLCGIDATPSLRGSQR